MMASKKGYRDVANFSDDSKMVTDYVGLIARGNRYFVSRFINVNDGETKLTEISADDAEKIQEDFDEHGWSEYFIDRWIVGIGIW